MTTHAGTVEFAAQRFGEEQPHAELRQRIGDRRQRSARAGVTSQPLGIDQCADLVIQWCRLRAGILHGRVAEQIGRLIEPVTVASPARLQCDRDAQQDPCVYPHSNSPVSDNQILTHPAILNIRPGPTVPLDRSIADLPICVERSNFSCAANLGGAEDAAVALFTPFDQAGDFATLESYLAYPNFDISNYPNFLRAVAGQGIEDRQVLPAPYACTR